MIDPRNEGHEILRTAPLDAVKDPNTGGDEVDLAMDKFAEVEKLVTVVYEQMIQDPCKANVIAMLWAVIVV